MKKKNDDELLSTEEILKKEKHFEDAMTCAICSIGFSSATATIVSLLTGCIDKPETLPYFIAGGAVASPLFYILLRKLREKMDDKFRKDMTSAENLLNMMQEVFSPDRIINETTSVFWSDIDLKFESNNIYLPEHEKYCLNKLLYLINLNYFEKISKTLPTITREKLINHVIDQTVIYYKRTAKKTFDENDAKEIIDYCLLIKPEIKEEIISEFKSSKVKIANEKDYAIAKHGNTTLYELGLFEEFSLKQEESGYNFDITSLNDLHTLIVAASEKEYYTQFGNAHELDWDMDFLKRVLVLIAANYRQELIEYHNDYSNLALASSLITNSITYALVNNRSEVGQREILSSFKNWRYIPFTMQDKILTKLFEEDEIDYSLHPYRERRDPKVTKGAKIIKLSDHFFRKNKTTDN